MKVYLPSTFILRYVEAIRLLCMNLLLNLINRTIDMISKINLKIVKNLCTYKVNGELFSCGPSRAGDIQNFALLVLFNGLLKFAQNFTDGFLKLLPIHPIHLLL